MPYNYGYNPMGPGTGGAIGSFTPASSWQAGAGGGGRRFDPEKLQDLTPVISMLVAALASGKGYGGIGAGSAAQMSNLLAQQEEERKRYGQERERQARQDEMIAAEWEQRQEEWKQKQEEIAKRKQFGLGWLAPELGVMGAGTPGTPGVPAAEYAWNRPGYAMRVAPEDRPAHAAAVAAGALPQDRPAVEAVPGTPGDPTAKMWSDLVEKSGAADWAMQGALGYYQASRLPQGEKRVRALFESFSKNNRNAAYALANYGAMSNEELDKRYDAAIREEADLRGEGMEWAKLRLGGEGGGAEDKDDPYKIYRGTPFVQQWNNKYNQYLKQWATENKVGIKEDPATGMFSITGESTTGAKPLSMEQWFRGQNRGAKAWSQYAAESGILGDPFYKTPQGMLVTEYGSVETAITEAIKAGKPKTWVQVLIDRNNENRQRLGKKQLDYNTWKQYVSS